MRNLWGLWLTFRSCPWHCPLPGMGSSPIFQLSSARYQLRFALNTPILNSHTTHFQIRKLRLRVLLGERTRIQVQLDTSGL